MKIKKRSPLFFALSFSVSFFQSCIAADQNTLDCNKLPRWTDSKPQVNLHHVFCGELNKRGKVTGFHAFPKDNKPSTFISAKQKTEPDHRGVFNMRNIKLTLEGKKQTKNFSSFFPEHCSFEHIVKSIQYSHTHSTGGCKSPSWAICGPSAPKDIKKQTGYCLGLDHSPFQIASPKSKSGRINTAFPTAR